MDMVGNWSSKGKGIRFVKDVCEVVKDTGIGVNSTGFLAAKFTSCWCVFFGLC